MTEFFDIFDILKSPLDYTPPDYSYRRERKQAREKGFHFALAELAALAEVWTQDPTRQPIRHTIHGASFAVGKGKVTVRGDGIYGDQAAMNSPEFHEGATRHIAKFWGGSARYTGSLETPEERQFAIKMVAAAEVQGVKIYAAYAGLLADKLTKDELAEVRARVEGMKKAEDTKAPARPAPTPATAEAGLHL